jgi:uncharacterized protein (TIGR02996 family)
VNGDERAFVVACRLALRGDELPRLIYADWLDEQGRQSEADAARNDLPRPDCKCLGNGHRLVGHKLVCLRCHGCGTIDRLEAEPVSAAPFLVSVPEPRVVARVVTEPCTACGGRGRSAVFSVCEECNGRWTPPLVPLSPGDPLYVDARGRAVPYPLTQGQKPVATFIRQGASVRSRLLADSDLLPGRQLVLEDGRPRRFHEDD